MHAVDGERKRVTVPASKEAEKGGVGTPARSRPAALTASSCAGAGSGPSSGCMLGTSSLSMLNDFLPEQLRYKSEASMLMIVSRPDWGAGEGEDAKCAALYSSSVTKHAWLRPCAGYTQELGAWYHHISPCLGHCHSDTTIYCHLLLFTNSDVTAANTTLVLSHQSKEHP